MKKELWNISAIEYMIDQELKRGPKNTLNFKSDNFILLSICLKGKSKGWRLKILEHSKKNYLEGGIYNEKRNCYYPKDLSTYEGIAEYNKLEKLFKRWGFTKL